MQTPTSVMNVNTPAKRVEFRNMQIRIFSVPIDDVEVANEELNAFLRSHRIVDIQQEFVASGRWTFCVRYLDSTLPRESKSKTGWDSSKKIDYKEVLSEKEFEIFSKLRMARKQIAGEEALPAFAVFTDAELGAMSKEEALTCASMKQIPGIGKGKILNFGEKLLQLAGFMPNENNGDEKT